MSEYLKNLNLVVQTTFAQQANELNKEPLWCPFSFSQIGLINAIKNQELYICHKLNTYLEYITVTDKTTLSWHPDKEQEPS